MCVTYVLLLSTLGLAIHTQAQGCPAPVAGEHMTLKDSVSQTYQDGDKVSFACDTGYTNVGSASITCTAGRWSPLKMRCERRNCGSADHEVENGNIDYSEGTEFGDKLVVTCKTGYNIVGKSQIFCGVQGWMSRLPECEVVICLPPSSGADVTFSPIKETYEYQDVVQYNCPKDYTLSGSKSLSCSEDGTFDPAPPTCVKVQCDDPNINAAKFVGGSRPPHQYKSTVTFECMPGYTMRGAPTQTCELDSQWSPGLPTCEPIQCEEPKIQNAERVEPPYKYKSTVTLKCISGYTMTGSSTQTCEVGSQWSPGLPTCRLIPTTTRPSTTKKTIVISTTTRPSTTKKTIVIPTTTRPSTTKKTIVYPGPTDSPPGNNGNAKAIGLGIGLSVLIGIVLTICGCYFGGVPAIIKEKRRSWRSSPDTVVPKEEEVALA